ncbi:50S ribosomal protein L4 [Candidatus Falkowbacteria bacterium]|nr:50S ribosomal protein L4 [Candidatus Falkowbacteria bacterium]
MSIKIKVYNQNAESAGEIELSPKVFGMKINNDLIHQAVITQMANERQPIAHTKDRSEVRGGGRKPWRQKGTGRARHGSSRSPIWIGGGVTFGPRNDRNFKKRINKKMKQNAMLMVLSDKAASDNFIILDKLEAAEFKTKAFNKIISGFENKILKSVKEANTVAKKKKAKRSFLIIVDKGDEKLNCSARNLTGIKLINIENINIVDLLKYKNLTITKSVVAKLEERYK